jgi:hypothetical protein
MILPKMQEKNCSSIRRMKMNEIFVRLILTFNIIKLLAYVNAF